MVGGQWRRWVGGCSLQPGGELSYSALESKKGRANRGLSLLGEDESPRAPWLVFGALGTSPSSGIRSIISGKPPSLPCGGGDHRASLGCSGVQDQNPGQERSVNAGADTSRPSSGRGRLCLPLQGADHKQSGASKEMRRGLNGNGGCKALGISTGRFWESQPAAMEGSTRGASGSTLTEDQQHVPGARPMHTTETHGDQQHPADLPRASHGGGSRPRGHVSTRAAPPRPRSRVHQARPGPAPAPAPPPSLVSADPLRRRRETRSCRDNGKSGAVASGECAADGGGAWDRDRVSEPPGYRPRSLVGCRVGGRSGVRECGRLPRGPLSHPLHPYPLHPHQVPYTLRLAGASRPQTVSRRGIPTP